jgi:hypothetical protein
MLASRELDVVASEALIGPPLSAPPVSGRLALASFADASPPESSPPVVSPGGPPSLGRAELPQAMTKTSGRPVRQWHPGRIISLYGEGDLKDPKPSRGTAEMADNRSSPIRQNGIFPFNASATP